MDDFKGIRAHQLAAKRIELFTAKNTLEHESRENLEKKERSENALKKLRLEEQEVAEEETTLRFKVASRKARLQLLKANRQQLCQEFDGAEVSLEKLKPRMAKIKKQISDLDYLEARDLPRQRDLREQGDLREVGLQGVLPRQRDIREQGDLPRQDIREQGDLPRQDIREQGDLRNLRDQGDQGDLRGDGLHRARTTGYKK